MKLIMIKAGLMAVLMLTLPMEYVIDINTANLNNEIENIINYKEDIFMNKENVTTKLMEILGCSENTASSLEETISYAGISQINKITAINDNVFKILQIDDSTDKTYYIFISQGYFIEKICVDSIDGKIIYREIQ